MLVTTAKHAEIGQHSKKQRNAGKAERQADSKTATKADGASVRLLLNAVCFCCRYR